MSNHTLRTLSRAPETNGKEIVQTILVMLIPARDPTVAKAMGTATGPMPMMNGGYIPVGGGAQAGMDALYIGDLNWVRTALSFTLHVHIFLMTLRSVFFLTLVDYGRRSSPGCLELWRQYQPQRHNLLGAQSEREEQRVSLPSRSYASGTLMWERVRIAYVECHDAQAAQTLKNWFENK